ncbi:hypothetical protein VOLCADRAFT_92959 [Volvox carteri f. nagariensis]|uniref:Protein kinase domain-containing protein n=1 Tax=Volvox carteri f. nagariensis TaxID=3068 RepID=D8U0Y8_VOLCA|nr:uncharacterized protein VOLCADRAFT_92959 [Volvox carteri f. nagariensis]EFJ46542.1 hypothetical protein VOLCADRAFT_92959 [Volvox carteri f. nagariensis]|eukprot:XP_002952399.1 hypothetical protein VOLCADRAFT_92959 [Volvox carteri f. nagariensis]
MPASSVGDSETRSINSFASSLSQRSFFGKLSKYELKRRFYEKLDDFKNKVLLHKEQGFIVYRARCMYSGGVVVLKGYSRESLTLQTRQRVYSEVSLLQRAQCPFILKCFDSFEDQVLLPILQTLAYLHAEGVIHRDIKPEHVLFNSEKVAKLSGFFLSWDVNRYSYPKDMVGTLDYVAPEVFVLNGPNAKQQQVTHYDYKVDIWGVGIMAYDVLVGTPPFNTDDPNTTVEGILMREAEYPDFMSDDAVDFIDQQLHSCCPPSLFPSSWWYNPMTWLRRRNSLEDLLAAENDNGGGGGGGGIGAGSSAQGSGGGGGGSGGGAGAGAAPGRGAWQLTRSLTSLARNFMGNRAQGSLIGMTQESGDSTTGGSGGAGAGGGGKKAFQMLPGRSTRAREDLEGVPEADEEGLDPEEGTGTLSSRVLAADGLGGGGGSLDSRKNSFTQGPYSPPPRPVLALHLNGGKAGVAVGGGGGGGGGANEDVQMLSERSLGGSSTRDSSINGGGGTAAAVMQLSGGFSSKALAAAIAAAAAAASGDATPTKSPAFLPHPVAATAPDVSDDVMVLSPEPGSGAGGGGGGCTASDNGARASADMGEVCPGERTGAGAGAAGRAATISPAAASLPRRLTTPVAHDSANSTEGMRRSGSQNSKSSVTKQLISWVLDMAAPCPTPPKPQVD